MPATAPTQSTDWMNPHAGEVRKLSTLLEVSQALLAARELKTGLIRVLEILGDHHGAVRSTVVLLDERTGDVAVEASAGAIDRDKPVRYRLGEGITGEVVQSGKPMVVPQVSHEPRFLNRAADAAGAGAAGTDLYLRADRARRTDGRRPRHRSPSTSRIATTNGPPNSSASWDR